MKKAKLAVNMGAVTKSEVEEFALAVLIDYPEWQFEWTPAAPSICIRERKRVLIHTGWVGRYPWEAKNEVLHEVAHINTTGHGAEFYQEFIRLLTKHMLDGD